MSRPRVASRWAIYNPDGMLVYVASNYEEEPMDSWSSYTGWASKDEIDDYQKRGYRCLRVYVTPR